MINIELPVREAEIERGIPVANPPLRQRCVYQYVRYGAHPDRTRPLSAFVPVFICAYYRNLQKVREKEIGVTAGGKEEMRISVVLAVRADGGKLPPLLIFKGKPTVKGKAPSVNSIERE